MSLTQFLNIKLCAYAFSVVVAFTSAPLFAQDKKTQAPHYMITAAYGLLSEPGEDKKYPVIYIPRGTLLYSVDHDSNEINQPYYSSAITQDGIKVHIKHQDTDEKRVISRAPVMGENSSFPDDNADLLIFHKEYELCRSLGCSDDRSVLEVQTGNVGEIVETINNFVKLRFLKDEYVSGYIHQNELKELQLHTNVTRINMTEESLQYPHFEVKTKTSRLLEKSCGIKAKEAQHADKDVTEDEERIIEAFQLGKVDRSNNSGIKAFVTLNPYGGEMEKWEHRYYKFNSNRKNIADKFFAVQIIYNCKRMGTLIEHKHISNVFLREIVNEVAGPPIELEPWMRLSSGADMDEHRSRLREKVRDPFLWSANTPEQHFSLMKILSKKFENRAIASYFYSEFNRGCYSSDRKEDICTIYSFSTD